MYEKARSLNLHGYFRGNGFIVKTEPQFVFWLDFVENLHFFDLPQFGLGLAGLGGLGSESIHELHQVFNLLFLTLAGLFMDFFIQHKLGVVFSVGPCVLVRLPLWMPMVWVVMESMNSRSWVMRIASPRKLFKNLLSHRRLRMSR